MRPPSGGRGFVGRGRGRGSSRGLGSGRGRSGNFRDEGPPASIEGEVVCRSTNNKVPYFNGAVYLENKTQVGKIEEIFGAVNETMFTVKLLDGIMADSYTKGAKFYISADKLLPIERFTNPVKSARGAGRGSGGRGGRAGRGRGGGRGGRGVSSRGRGRARY